MRLRLQLISAALVISLNCLYSQEYLPGYIISLLEDITSSSDENTQAFNLAEEITDLAENPVDINSRRENEIKRLFFLTAFQVHSIIDYTIKNGDILSASEISYIPGFDRELTELVSHFIICKHNDNDHKKYTRNDLRLISNILADDKDTKNDYLGNKYKMLTKLRLSSGPVELYLTFDKDSGEPVFLEGYKPDFLSGNITYYPDGLINKIIIGDYKVRFGQGLCVWNGFSRPPVPTEQRPMKGSSGIIPNSSSDENDFFRGIAISLSKSNFNISSFASKNMIDATINFDEETETKYIKSFYYSGIHNTPTTIMKKNQVVESSLGININSLIKNFYFGINAIYTRFSIPVIRTEQPRNRYDFEGKVNASFSLDYAYLLKDSYLFGEFALDNTLKTAFLQGISMNPDGKVRCNIMYSRTGRGYNSFHGHASGITTFNKPGSSLLANLSAELTSYFTLSGGFLRKKELWYNDISGGFPSSVNYLLKLKLSPADFISVGTDIRHRINDKWISPEQGIKTGISVKQTSFRLSLETVISDRFKLNSRIEKVIAAETAENGFLCYQSAAYAFREIPLEIRGRLSVFSTDSYETRIYTWEDDLLYNPVIKSLYDEGKRSYLMIIYRAFNKITLRVKYAFTDIRDDQGGSETVNELKFQVVLRF